MNYYEIFPETLINCPYEISHVITAQRFINHLEKCAKDYIGTDTLMTCPFNSQHIYNNIDFLDHVKDCLNRCYSDEELLRFENDSQGFTAPPIKSSFFDPCEESWEPGYRRKSILDEVKESVEDQVLYVVPSGMKKKERKEIRNNGVAKCKMMESGKCNNTSSVGSTTNKESYNKIEQLDLAKAENVSLTSTVQIKNDKNDGRWKKVIRPKGGRKKNH